MITFAVTAWNEHLRGGFAWLKECLEVPLAHPCVDEVLVYDDGSDERWMGTLERHSKLTIVLGRTNLGVFGAKIEAVAHSSGEWVITMDSDNHMDAALLTMLAKMPKHANDWYLPSFAIPAFDYRHFIGSWRLATIHAACDLPRFDCFFNTGNQMVQRGPFMEVFSQHRGRKLAAANGATDSMMFNDAWLRHGGNLVCTPGYEYQHRINTGKASNYNRAPDEKTKIGKALMSNLKADSLRKARQ